jgi:hypothetical protein
VKPVGLYMTKVFNGERTWLSPLLRPVERLFYRLSGVRKSEDQHWLAYAFAMLLFNAAGFLLLYAILRLQANLPLNPQGFGNLAPDLAFNTAICSHPFQVIAVVLKLFRPEQGVGHVAEEKERHARAEDRVEHGSDPRAAARIDQRAQEQGGTESDEDEVEHDVDSMNYPLLRWDQAP